MFSVQEEKESDKLFWCYCEYFHLYVIIVVQLVLSVRSLETEDLDLVISWGGHSQRPFPEQQRTD